MQRSSSGAAVAAGKERREGHRMPSRLSRMSQRSGGTLKRAEYNLHMRQRVQGLLEKRS